jgi:hypothetical protein
MVGRVTNLSRSWPRKKSSLVKAQVSVGMSNAGERTRVGGLVQGKTKKKIESVQYDWIGSFVGQTSRLVKIDHKETNRQPDRDQHGHSMSDPSRSFGILDRDLHIRVGYVLILCENGWEAGAQLQ